MRKISLLNQLSFSDWMEIIRKDFSTLYSGDILPSVFDSITTNRFSSDIANNCQLLSIDYLGHGFPQFNRLFMNEAKWGSVSVDEYISKAFPSKNPPSYQIVNEAPKFWQGEIPEKLLKRFVDRNIFFIVRIKASFKIKPGHHPFVYYRSARKNGKIDDNNNFLKVTGTLIKSCDKPIIITLTKDDFFLFNTNYNIESITFLDGCFWDKKE